VFRILATLQSRNYIEQNRANDNYRLGSSASNWARLSSTSAGC